MKIMEVDKGQEVMDKRISALTDEVSSTYETLIPAFMLDLQNPRSALSMQVMSAAKGADDGGEAVMSAMKSRIMQETGMQQSAVEALLNQGSSQFEAKMGALKSRANLMQRDDAWKRMKVDFDQRSIAGVSDNAHKIVTEKGVSFVTVHDTTLAKTPELTNEQLFGKNNTQEQANAFQDAMKDMIESDPDKLKAWGVEFRGTDDKGIQRVVIPTQAMAMIQRYAKVTIPSGYSAKDISIFREAGGILNDKDPADSARRRTDLVTKLGGSDELAKMVQDEKLIPVTVKDNAPSLLISGFKSQDPAVRKASILAAQEYVYVTKAKQLKLESSNVQAEALQLVSSMGFTESTLTGLRRMIQDADKLPPSEREGKFTEIIDSFTNVGVKMIKESSDPAATLRVMLKGKASPLTHIGNMSKEMKIIDPLKKELGDVTASEDNKHGSPNLDEALRLDNRSRVYYRMAKAFYDAAHPVQAEVRTRAIPYYIEVGTQGLIKA
jgi:hypothetical protein